MNSSQIVRTIQEGLDVLSKTGYTICDLNRLSEAQKFSLDAMRACIVSIPSSTSLFEGDQAPFTYPLSIRYKPYRNTPSFLITDPEQKSESPRLKFLYDNTKITDRTINDISAALRVPNSEFDPYSHLHTIVLEKNSSRYNFSLVCTNDFKKTSWGEVTPFLFQFNKDTRLFTPAN